MYLVLKKEIPSLRRACSLCMYIVDLNLQVKTVHQINLMTNLEFDPGREAKTFRGHGAQAKTT